MHDHIKIENINYFKELSIENWMDWIEDILYYNTAYPFSTIIAERDVLQDMHGWLKEHSISPGNYEQSLIAVGAKLVIEPFKNIAAFERILEAIGASRSLRAKKFLLTVLIDRRFYTLEYVNRIESRVMLSLSLLPLNKDDCEFIKSSVSNAGKKLLSVPSLVGNYLRFILNTDSPEEFFASITIALLSFEEKDQVITQSFLVTVEDKLREYHYKSELDFFKYFYVWLKRDYNALFKVPLANKMISSFSNYLKRFENKIHQNHYQQQYYLLNNVQLLLDTLVKTRQWTTSSLKILNDLAKFLLDTGGSHLFDHIAKHNIEIIGSLDHYENDLFLGEQLVSKSDYGCLLILRNRFFSTNDNYNRILKQEMLSQASFYE